MQDIAVSCKKCGNKVTASSLKLDLDEKMMICSDCIKNKKIHKEIQEGVFSKKGSAKQTEEEKSSKIAHKCTSCGYKFMINPETRTPKSCPYCNTRVLIY